MRCESLREFKDFKKISNKQLAEMFGVSIVYISFLLNNKRTPSKELAIKISEKTGIPILNLLFPENRKLLGES